MTKKSTLPVEQTSAATFHKESTQWRPQDALWLDELSFFHKEHEIALTELARLEQTYHELADSAGKLREQLQTHEQSLHAHERVLAEYLQGRASLSFDVLEQQQEQVRAEHAERQKQFEQTQQLFRRMMSKVEAVRRALAA